MKQVFQDLRKGTVEVCEVPVPRCRSGSLLIRASCSLVSTGTERSLVEFGKAGYLAKARQQPDKVKMVFEKARTDGVMATLEAVRSKLNEPIPLGYSSVGTVIEVGERVEGFQMGDRVVSNGNHAEVVCVPKNLCAKIPDGVDDESASFTILGAIALQGVRLAAPTLGETVVVTGLGMIGLITVTLLRASGCRVVGIDFDKDKLDLAESRGARVVRLEQGQDPVGAVDAFTNGMGADAIIITASTESNEVIQQAAEMSRKRGRIVLVGVIGLNLRRADFYEKELTFQVSCSYGPGRYDPEYEEDGIDYPPGFVRWTANRNFKAVLELIESGSIELEGLLTERYDIASAPAAYRTLLDDPDILGILLEYPAPAPGQPLGREVILGSSSGRGAKGTIGAIGAGSYAGRVLLPAFRDTGARLRTVVSCQGKSGHHVARRLGFEINSTDIDSVLADPQIDAVVVGTRHGSHARLVVAALDAGKDVFVEKPLAMSQEELENITEARERAIGRGEGGRVMVGFNRRFAPLMVRLQSLTEASPGPLSIVYTCNAGDISADSWVHDRTSGGGRLLGEACHFIDIARSLAGSPIHNHSVQVMRDRRGLGDTASIHLGFQNGSIASVHYFANGNKLFPKERIEVFQGGRVLVLDNFRKLAVHGKGRGRWKLKQDKGQAACVAAFMRSIRDGTPAPIAYDELLEVSRVTVEVARAARSA